MRLYRLFLIATLSMLFVCMVFYRSIFDYFAHTYRVESLLEKEGGESSLIARALEDLRVSIFEWNYPANPDSFLGMAPSDLDSNLARHEALDLEAKPHPMGNEITGENPATTESKIPLEAMHKVRLVNGKLSISKEMEFLLIGDSLMQGIGLTLVSSLRKIGLTSHNLAKQSTGLSYKKNLDWAEVTRQALQNNPNIAVLVVCLGANDPSNIGGARFNTDKWREIYKSRIREILDIASEHGVFVLWYEIPAVREAKLNEKVAVLNSLYAESLENRGIFIPTTILSEGGKFRMYIKNDDGKNVLVRASDGLHFSAGGSRILSALLIDRLEVQELAPPRPSSIESAVDSGDSKAG